MNSESGSMQRNSALDLLKQRQKVSAMPPTLMEQKPSILYTMPMQTVERLEDVLRKTLALQESIRAGMDTLATREPGTAGHRDTAGGLAGASRRGPSGGLPGTAPDGLRDGGGSETGWEAARRIYEAALRAGQGIPRGWLRADAYLPEMGGPHHPEFRGGSPGDQHSSLPAADVTEDVLHLLSRLEGSIRDKAIDATMRHLHGDRKTLAREQRKKIALGHKADDHE